MATNKMQLIPLDAKYPVIDLPDHLDQLHLEIAGGSRIFFSTTVMSAGMIPIDPDASYSLVVQVWNGDE